MTTFNDREHAIEAHYAALELSAFTDKAHQYKLLGARLAADLGMEDAESQRFAARVAERCVTSLDGGDFRKHLETEWTRMGYTLPPNAFANHAGAEAVPHETPHAQPWTEFVIQQLLKLFGTEAADAKA